MLFSYQQIKDTTDHQDQLSLSALQWHMHLKSCSNPYT